MFFNLSSPVFCKRIHNVCIFIKLWNFFIRDTDDGDRFWGIGLLQINDRHLVYIGHSGYSIFFIGTTE